MNDGPGKEPPAGDGPGDEAVAWTDPADRVAALAAAAAEARRGPSPDPPAEDRAMALLRDGLGPTVAVYVEARSGEGPGPRFEPATLDRLQAAVNDWLAAYAACYGVEVDPDVTIRQAAELVIETHDIADTAQLLTGVPERH